MTQVVSSIRRARADDAHAISECVAAAYRQYLARIRKPPAPMLDDYTKVICQHGVFVVTVCEKVIGVLVLIKQEETLMLDNVAVHPDYQGRGLGQRLIAFAEEEAINAGFNTLMLYTNEQMTENIELYKKLGFVETGRKADQGYRRVYMRKTF
jgi:ribosomal protein S18 acetylase RimI-like enzyme